MTQVMLDIETLGQRPGSIVTAIGACKFDWDQDDVTETSSMFYVPVDISDAGEYGMVADPATVRWWSLQDPHVMQEALQGEIPLKDALMRFSAWFKASGSEVIWAKPPSFDVSILEACYVFTDLTTPWHFRAPRCLRTLLQLAGDLGDSTPVRRGDEHNALHDAVYQARLAIAAHAQLRRTVQ